jgi:hypothetical protein
VNVATATGDARDRGIRTGTPSVENDDELRLVGPGIEIREDLQDGIGNPVDLIECGDDDAEKYALLTPGTRWLGHSKDIF